MTPTVKILGQICSFLELTHSVRSPLGSRKAIQNRFAEQTGNFIFEDDFWGLTLIYIHGTKINQTKSEQ